MRTRFFATFLSTVLLAGLVPAVGGTPVNPGPATPPNDAALCASLPRPMMRIRLVIDGGVPEDLRPQVESIVATVWRGEGLTVEWLPHPTAVGDNDLRLVVTTRAFGDAGEGDPILGAVHFLDGVPQRDVMVSWTAARGWAQRQQARAVRPLFGSLTQKRALEFGGFEALARRALAYAAAHEVGHFVLGSTTHDRTGLMRRDLQPRVVAAVEHRDLNLSSRSRLRLQQRLAQGAACAPAAGLRR